MIFALAFLQPPAPILRFDKFLGAHPDFQVEVQVTTSRGEKGDGSLIIKRPSYASMVVRFPDVTYKYVSNPKGSIISNSRMRQYELLPFPIGPAYTLSAVLNGDERPSLPFAFFTGSTTKGFQGDVTFKEEGTETVAGVKADKVMMLVVSPTIHFRATLSVDAEGKLVKFAQDVSDPTPYVVTSTFSNYAYANASTALFALQPDDGFIPEEEPVQMPPLGIDSAVPSGILVDGSGKKKDLTTLLPKSGMIAVVEAEWLNSANGKKAITQVREAMKADGGPLILICINGGGRPKTSQPVYVDPTGKLVETLRPLGTPMFYLVNKKNRIERLWYGYQPKDKHFIAELKEAIARPGVSRPT